MMDIAQHNINLHQSLRQLRDGSEDYQEKYRWFAGKYRLDVQRI